MIFAPSFIIQRDEMNQYPHIATIVVTHNRKELLLTCIQCLQKQTYHTDILVFDNASNDGTDDAVKHLVETGTIYYENTGKNLGGAGGFHYGIHCAMQLNYDYFWVMDDDCLAKPNALEHLMKRALKMTTSFGFLCSKVNWTNDELCDMNRQKSTPYRDTTDFHSEQVPVSMSSFVGLLLPRRVVQKFGLPIKEFFIWSDDWEYTRRISRQLSCYLINQSVVVHAMKNNTVVNIATDQPERLPRYRYFYRNDVVLYRREGLIGMCYLVAKNVWHSLQVLRFSHGSRLTKLGIIWSGFFAGLRFHPSIEYPNTINEQK